MAFYNQSEFQFRCEWGARGVEQLAPISDVVIIVDVLSFSTCVEIATSRGAIVFPFPWQQTDAEKFAADLGAELAARRGDRGDHRQYSLSPQSLSQIPEGTRLVLPSPNGATLSLATGDRPTLAGCLRNSQAVAKTAMVYGQSVAVIPAGEKWPDGSLRPALEDWVGVGAILSHFKGRFSPEAEGAIATYERAIPSLTVFLKQCSSGKELIGKGFETDVDLAAQLRVSHNVPILQNGAYIPA